MRYVTIIFPSLNETPDDEMREVTEKAKQLELGINFTNSSSLIEWVSTKEQASKLALLLADENPKYRVEWREKC